MKPDAVKSWLEYSTGHKIDKQTLIYWENEGLLGEVVRVGKDRRDYSSSNISRILITLVLRNAGWTLGNIKKIYSKDPQVLDQANKTLDTIERGLVPALKEARKIL